MANDTDSEPPFHRKEKGINLNSVLIMIVLGLSGWTLTAVNSQSRDAAVTNEKVNRNTADLVDLRLRCSQVELNIQQLQLRMAAAGVK